MRSGVRGWPQRLCAGRGGGISHTGDSLLRRLLGLGMMVIGWRLSDDDDRMRSRVRAMRSRNARGRSVGRASCSSALVSLLFGVVLFSGVSNIVSAQFPAPVPSPFPDNRPPRRTPIPGTRGPTETHRTPAPDLPVYRGPNIFYGVCIKVEEKLLTLEAYDKQIYRIHLKRETKFFDDEDEIQRTSLHKGDELRVEAQRGPKGFLTAERVFRDKKAPPEVLADSREDRDKDPNKDPHKDAGEPQNPPQPSVTIHTSDPLGEHEPVDEDDPGPPKLRRKSPEEAARIHKQRAANAERAANSPPPASRATLGERASLGNSAPRTEFPLPPVVRKPDPLIEKVRENTLAFAESLPNFICRQIVARFESTTRPADWVAQDIIEANVAYEDGAESYQEIKRNGKKVKKKMEELDGAWSRGEYGTVPRNLFDPWTMADFKYRKYDSSTRPKSKVYSFHVERERSNWQANVASASYVPEYKGSVWIDETTQRLVRIEMQALNLPLGFPLDTMELTIDYAMIRIGSQEYLLPAHSSILSCSRGSARCTWNKIEFRNYRKFSSESFIFNTDSDVSFDDKEAPGRDSPSQEPAKQ